MSPTGMAVIFGLLGAVAAWAIWRDMTTGISGDSLYRFRADTNPVGFTAVIGGKFFVLGFGIAEILHAMGLVGDPMTVLRAVFG